MEFDEYVREHATRLLRLATVMCNEAVSWRRKWGRIETRPSHLLDRTVADPATAVDDRNQLVGAVRLLPPKQRAAVVLRYFEDLPEGT